MAKKYTIRAGFSFIDGDQVKVGGDTVVIEDDVAQGQLHKLEPVVAASAEGMVLPAAQADVVRDMATEA